MKRSPRALSRAGEIGIQDNNNVEIKSGVEQGAEVFTQYMTGSATSWDNYGMVY